MSRHGGGGFRFPWRRSMVLATYSSPLNGKREEVQLLLQIGGSSPTDDAADYLKAGDPLSIASGPLPTTSERAS